MFSIDKAKCTGCGSCIDVCSQKAITIHDNLAMINKDLCIQCGNCARVCPAGAIGELVTASIKLPIRGGMIQYGYGRGFGFRGSSPSWPYVGRGRGRLPRSWYPGLRGAASYTPPAPYRPATKREKELGFLKNQAEAMNRQLEDIERRIQEIKRKN